MISADDTDGKAKTMNHRGHEGNEIADIAVIARHRKAKANHGSTRMIADQENLCYGF